MSCHGYTHKLIILGSISSLLTGCAKPIGNLTQLRQCNYEKDLCYLEAASPLPDKPLTLCDVVSLGLQRNMDLIVQDFQRRVQNYVANAASLQQLPRLTLEGELGWRDKPPASIYRNLTTGQESTGTISQEQTTYRWDVRGAFNLLDFGLSYYRARQEKDRILLLNQQHMKARQNLILDLVRGYWRVIVAQKNEMAALEMINTIEETQEALRRQYVDQTLPELAILRYEKELLDMHRRLSIIQYELQSAKLELASLMGAPSNIDFQVADVELEEHLHIDYDLRNLEDIALKTRPELFVHDIEEHIYADEVRASLLRIFPNVEFFARFDEDHNRLLVHNSWNNYGVIGALELLNIPQHINRAKAAKFHKIAVSNQRLATSIGIITQVNLAHISYLQRLDQFRLANNSAKVQEDLLKAATKEYELGDLSGVELLDIKYDTIVAQIDAWTAYADLKFGIEQLNNAIGQPLCLGSVEDTEDEVFIDNDLEDEVLPEPEIKEILPEPEIKEDDIEEETVPPAPLQEEEVTPMPAITDQLLNGTGKPAPLFYTIPTAQGRELRIIPQPNQQEKPPSLSQEVPKAKKAKETSLLSTIFSIVEANHKIINQ